MGTSLELPVTEVLEQLGLEPARVLPATVTCPVCRQKKLRVFPQDTRSPHGQHYCSICGKGGDLVELAAVCWQVEPWQALERLAATYQRTPATKRYDREHRDRDRCSDLWRRALTNTANSQHRAVLDRFDLTFPLDPQRWETGPGRLFGFSCRKEVDVVLQPGSISGGCSRAQHSPLRGRRWREVIVIPRFVVPDHPVAFHFLGRQRDQSLAFPGRNPQERREAGLVGLAGVGDADQVVALSDPLQLLQLQSRHFYHSLRPLPLVAWHHAKTRSTRRAWHYLQGRRIVHWAAGMSEALVIQLLRTEGELWLESQVEPERLVAGALRHGQPWRDALSCWLERQSETQIRQVWQWLKLWGETSIQPGRRAAKFLSNDPGLRSVLLNGSHVVENSTGWFLTQAARHRTRRCVLDAVVRIDQVVYFTDLDRTLLKGRVLYRGREYDFAVERHELERRPGEWLERFLIRQRAGLLQHDRRWSSRLLQLATLFSPPQVIHDAGQDRWDELVRSALPPSEGGG